MWYNLLSGYEWGRKELKKSVKRLLAACLLLAIAMGTTAYLLDGYDAAPDALAAMQGSVHNGHAQVFEPEAVRAGLIFYPGGLVDHEAYAPLMQALAERGILCLLTEMPLDLAVLDMNAADGLQALYPQVERWLIGGHSLGGAMAAGYAAKHAGAYHGLVLLGAYSTADLRGTDLSVLSIYGTQDGVLNREKYEACRKYYPERFEEIVIDGGNHAYFGDYGAQKGDGEAEITREEQMRITADAIVNMLN